MQLPSHENLDQKFQNTVRTVSLIYFQRPDGSGAPAAKNTIENYIRHDEHEIVLKPNKILNCRWATCYLDRFLKIEPNGSVILESIDHLCKIKLHPCGELFELQYLKLLKNKKVQHVDASLFPECDYPQGTPESQNDTTFDLNNISAIEIANDIQSNLNKTLTSMRGGQTSNLAKKRFVSAFQYANVKKFYHVSNFPRELTYP